jgi:chromosome segregation ATPase
MRIAKAAEERKSVSMSFWHGKRAFEEDWADLHGDLVSDYGVLSRGETERDRLRNELAQVKRETAKLEHWKELQSREYDRMESEQRALFHVREIDVTSLLMRLSDAQAELDNLVTETDQLEESINLEIREPMAEMDEVRRRIQRVQIESAEIRRHSSRAPRPNKAVELAKENLVNNRRLKALNGELKLKLTELEGQISAMKPIQLAMIKALGKVEPRVLSSRSEKKLFIPEIPVRPVFTSGILPRNPYL